MLLHIPGVLTREQVAWCRREAETADWVDGRATSGHLSAKAKNNVQIRAGHPAARTMGDTILAALEGNPLFLSAALPLKVYPPLFNRYAEGQTFGTHVDNAICIVPGSPQRVRSDLSATLFLTDPADYDGGALVMEDTYGTHHVKLPAGDMVLYPSSSLHRVEPVTRGVRFASFFWIQSMVRDDGERTLLFDLDSAIQDLNRGADEQPTVVQLTGIYHNLLRRWADA
ncbi:MAG: Fe2+-dependent dioxygenase [Azospirillaceae bacterium]|nr:Fe2+-dependent dioxygenase [Azospirillaceae bacterium]